MIKTETYTLNGREFVRTYSDAGRYVVRDGIAYAEANDPADLGRAYTEGAIIPADAGSPYDAIPAWDITQSEYIRAGDLVARDGITYRCTQGHYAAWSKQPPNQEFWEAIT